MQIEIDYPINPRSREPSPTVETLISGGVSVYRKHLTRFLRHKTALLNIPRHPINDADPAWVINWIPALDGVALYSFVAERNPRSYVEIGSGESTKFVRRSIADAKLRTQMISVDPQPRREIDQICDIVIRRPLEDCPLETFSRLRAGDILFFDGSHRTLQNSDVTVFFTEIVPMLPAGVLVGVHDIFLPWDYPPDWHGRFYSEQYMLATYIIGSNCRIELPAYYVSQTPSLHSVLDPLWKHETLSGAQTHGGAFWFTTRRRSWLSI